MKIIIYLLLLLTTIIIPTKISFIRFYKTLNYGDSIRGVDTVF